MENNFKKELKELLKKYDASISFTVADCSDTYGLSDEKLIVDINGKEILLVNGWSINDSDL